MTDVKRFKQVLFNLLGNALKFTMEGFIALRITFIERTSTLVAEIEDSGMGIEKDDLAKLFQFFGTLKKSKDINRGGMGLGLTISKMIINQFGGIIDVTSEFGVGTKFTFTIPLQENLADLEEESKCQNVPSLKLSQRAQNTSIRNFTDSDAQFTPNSRLNQLDYSWGPALTDNFHDNFGEPFDDENFSEGRMSHDDQRLLIGDRALKIPNTKFKRRLRKGDNRTSFDVRN